MKNIIKYVWLPQYCSCIYESAFESIAICSTRKKARQLLKEHKNTVWYPGKRKYSWEIWRIRKAAIV